MATGSAQGEWGLPVTSNNIAEPTDAGDQAGILATWGSPSPQPARQLIRAFPT